MHVPVLLPKVFNYPLTYKSEKIKFLKPGEFVIVPFGKKMEVGVVWDKIHKTTKKIQIKPIESHPKPKAMGSLPLSKEKRCVKGQLANRKPA